MRQIATAAQPLVGLIGLVMIVLGLLFWSGNMLALVPVHMLLGLLLVVLLWSLAIMGARAHVPAGLVALAIAWGFVVPGLGLLQGELLPGDSHWVVQVLHLLVGMIGIGLAERLAARIKRVTAAREGGVR